MKRTDNRDCVDYFNDRYKAEYIGKINLQYLSEKEKLFAIRYYQDQIQPLRGFGDAGFKMSEFDTELFLKAATLYVTNHDDAYKTIKTIMFVNYHYKILRNERLKAGYKALKQNPSFFIDLDSKTRTTIQLFVAN